MSSKALWHYKNLQYLLFIVRHASTNVLLANWMVFLEEKTIQFFAAANSILCLQQACLEIRYRNVFVCAPSPIVSRPVASRSSFPMICLVSIRNELYRFVTFIVEPLIRRKDLARSHENLSMCNAGRFFGTQNSNCFFFLGALCLNEILLPNINVPAGFTFCHRLVFWKLQLMALPQIVARLFTPYRLHANGLPSRVSKL